MAAPSCESDAGTLTVFMNDTLPDIIGDNRNIILDFKNIRQCLFLSFLIFITGTIYVAWFIRRRLYSPMRHLSVVLALLQMVGGTDLVVYLTLVATYIYSGVVSRPNKNNILFTCQDLDRSSMIQHLLSCLYICGTAAVGPLCIFRNPWTTLSCGLPVFTLLFILPLVLLTLLPGSLQQTTFPLQTSAPPIKLCVEDWVAPSPFVAFMTANVISVLCMAGYTLMSIRKEKQGTTMAAPLTIEISNLSTVENTRVDHNPYDVDNSAFKQVVLSVQRAVLMSIPLQASLVTVYGLNTEYRCMGAAYNIFLAGYLTVYIVFKLGFWPVILSMALSPSSEILEL